jgi:hypothetical protein
MSSNPSNELDPTAAELERLMTDPSTSVRLTAYFKADSPPIDFLSLERSNTNDPRIFLLELVNVMHKSGLEFSSSELNRGRYSRNDVKVILNAFGSWVDKNLGKVDFGRVPGKLIHPIESLPNNLLFKAKGLGLQMFMIDRELLRRLKVDPQFIDEMFKFSENKTNGDIRFYQWFDPNCIHSHDVCAEIISVIAKNINYKPKAAKFLPAFPAFFSSASPEKAYATLASYLTCIDNPEDVYGNAAGAMSPVFMSLKYLNECTDQYSDLFLMIRNYAIKYQGDISKHHDFVKSNYEMIESYSRSFALKIFKVDTLIDFAVTISFLDNKDMSFSVNENSSFAEKLLSSKMIEPRLVAETLLNAMVSGDVAREELISLAANKSNYEIISKIIPKDELMKSGSRMTRGHILEDELGL